MNATPGQLFTLNGINYDSSLLPPQGQHLLALLTEAETELTRLATRKALLQAAQQQLISQLKPLLPVTTTPATNASTVILGQASNEIPTTPAEQPAQDPSPLPDSLPAEIRTRRP